MFKYVLYTALPSPITVQPECFLRSSLAVRVSFQVQGSMMSRYIMIMISAQLEVLRVTEACLYRDRDRDTRMYSGQY
jgi:hypothetical protein